VKDGVEEVETDIITWWAGQDLPDWRKFGKIKAPRVCLAKLKERRDIKEVNEYLRKLVPWSNPGTDLKFLYRGDYDFTITVLTTILYQFGNDDSLLYPATRSNILGNLLTLSGPVGTLKVPFTLGIIGETENHILMMEGSRFLKNQWLKDHGSNDESHDNQLNGLEQFLSRFIHRKRELGLEEYNSQPYMGYTITALLNLHAYAEGKVGIEASGLLDRQNEKYALGSFSFRRYPPFRRRLNYARERKMDRDYQTRMMKVWYSRNKTVEVKSQTQAKEHTIMAAIMPYEISDRIRQLLGEEDRDYILRIGHGKGRSPEIYSKGPGYLITGGGSRSRLFTIEVTRPITLILDDDALELKDVLHMGRLSYRLKGFNQNGVAGRFAVSKGPLHIPQGWIPHSTIGNWAHFVKGDISIITFSSKRLGIFSIIPGADPEGLLQRIEGSNHDERKLMTEFFMPDGTEYSYELNSPRDMYMIRSAGDRSFDRDFSRWPYWDMSSI
jgi:hypothetical protein